MFKSQYISISNPLTKDATLEVIVSNPHDFQILYPKVSALSSLHRSIKNNGISSIKLKPFEQVELQIVFWPSSLTETITGTIHITSAQLGNFEYNVQGTGQLPEPMEGIIVRSILNKTATSVLTFTNPLIDPIPITVHIVEEEDPQSPMKEFNLMLQRKSKYNVGGLESIDIPFSYAPKRMMGRASTISVEMGQLRWIYPIMVHSNIFNCLRVEWILKLFYENFATRDCPMLL